LVLRVADVRFNVHKAIITQHSNVIDEMIDMVGDAGDGGVVTLVLPSVTPDAVRAVLVSVYDERFDVVVDDDLDKVRALAYVTHACSFSARSFGNRRIHCRQGEGLQRR
jgi:hypothetical protein